MGFGNDVGFSHIVRCAASGLLPQEGASITTLLLALVAANLRQLALLASAHWRGRRLVPKYHKPTPTLARGLSSIVLATLATRRYDSILSACS